MLERFKRYLLLTVVCFFVLAAGCQNPFSPDIIFDNNVSGGGIADMTQVEGVFQNLKMAYAQKDTLVYGETLNSNFSFSFRDYDAGYDVTWGRGEEMKITQNLFHNAERLDLTWNNILLNTTDSVNATIIRSFNLTIVFNPSDMITIDGKVNMQLLKNPDNGKWSIVNWKDESNF